jgi:stage II sporulation protein E
MELDLMTAEASFIKSGAAPSFIVRKKAVHRLQVGSAPIGIIRTVQTQATPFLLKEGDTVVMISDGILQNDPECEWLVEYLASAAELSPEEIVYQICLHAANTNTQDDCSAVALRILPADQAGN